MYDEQFNFSENSGIEPADFCPCKSNQCTSACTTAGLANCFHGCKGSCQVSCSGQSVIF